MTNPTQVKYTKLLLAKFNSRTAPGTVVTHGKKAYIVRACDGEAHTNAYIDHCGCCLRAHWGRILVHK